MADLIGTVVGFILGGLTLLGLVAGCAAAFVRVWADGGRPRR